MNAEQGTGGSLRSHLESVWEQTGVKPDELEETDCPDAIKHVWSWFLELHRTRGAGMSANPVNYQEIHAWAGLTQRTPTPFEVQCLTDLDSVWLSLQKDK